MKLKATVAFSILCLLLQAHACAQIVKGGDSTLKKRELASLSESIKNSDLIIEGTVTEQHAFWNNTRTSVLTSFSVTVYKVFKGHATGKAIKVVCMGGILPEKDSVGVGSKGMVVADGYSLSPQQEGIFFLKADTTSAMIKDTSVFVLYDAHQFRFFYDAVNYPASFGALRFKNVRNEVYPLICGILKKQYTVVAENPGRVNK